MVYHKQKNKAKIKCYNYNKKGHYARERNEPKKVLTLNELTYVSYSNMIVNMKTIEPYRNASISYVTASMALVASSAYLTKSHPLWTVDL